MDYTRNSQVCKSMKLRMVIGGWIDYYVNHSDDRAAFNVHGTRVNVFDITTDVDKIEFQWDFNILQTTVGNITKTMTLIDNWLKVE